jgi:LmbE family N-acetylglucosaminyl deacetylase
VTATARDGAGLPTGIPWAPVLAVVAHPDDESFGLGALLAALVDSGREVRVLCLTHGEASTLGARADLAEVRRAELSLAAEHLGVSDVTLDDFPDGGLADVDGELLDETIDRHLGSAGLLVVFEPGGVTGHPDHQAATAAAERIAARHGLAVLDWGVAPEVADALRREFGASFVALDGTGVTDLSVDRTRQMAAIACHTSQATDNPVVVRRIGLQGDWERVRLRPPRSG